MLREGAVFSKMSDFSPFLRNRQSRVCGCSRSCMARCPGALIDCRQHCPGSLIQPRSRSFLPDDFRFSQQKMQYLFFCAISCSFFSPRRACTRSIMVNFLILNHFSGLGAPFSHFRGASGSLRGASESIRGASDRFQWTSGR